jgi:hypothetical protein
MEDKPKYFRCSKCGESIRKVPLPSKVDLENMAICFKPMIERTSGICGGTFTVEITEEEYNAILNEWDNNRKNNN